MSSRPIPRKRQECPECGGRCREERTGTITCESCEWKRKRGEGLKPDEPQTNRMF